MISNSLTLLLYAVIAFVLEWLGTMDMIAVINEKKWKSGTITVISSLLGDFALFFIFINQNIPAFFAYALGAGAGAVYAVGRKRKDRLKNN